MDHIELVEAAREDHPEVVAELERLQAWVSVCLGAEVVAWDGLKVDA
jgi:hypothetical protein